MRFDLPTRIACLIGILVCLTNSPATFAQTFKWKLAAGERFDVQYIQQSNTSTKVTDRTTVIESETQLNMTWLVTEIDDQQNAIIEQAITAIRLNVGNPAVPDQRVSLDTGSEEKASGASAPLLKQMKPLVGLKFKVTMTPRGEIKDVSIPDDTMDVLRELPGSLNLQSLFSEQGLTELMGAAAIVLPEGEIETGESWETESRVENQFGQFNRNRNYTFTGTDENSSLATFKIETSMDQTAQASTRKPPMLIEFSESGSLKLDPAGGYFVSSDIKNVSKTEIPYREKKILTTVNSSIQMSIDKK